MERKNQLDALISLGAVNQCVDFILEKSIPLFEPADPLYKVVEKVFLESVLYYLLENDELSKNTDTLYTLVKEGYAKNNSYTTGEIDSILNDKFNEWIIKLEENTQNNIGINKWNIFKIYTPLTQIAAITQVKDRIESILNVDQENKEQMSEKGLLDKNFSNNETL